jgi:signal transduction histidine kinase
MDDATTRQAVPRGIPRILIFAPTGNDARVTAGFLSQSGHHVEICRDMAELCNEAATGCDMILLAEETLNQASVNVLGQMLAQQSPWSDIPIALITSGGDASPERLRILTPIGRGANVSLLERPFRRGTLLSTVEVALRARQRQYDVRDLLEERKNNLAMMENLVKERTSQLTETNEQLETLVYSIAHDLRAPLRSMQAFAKILLDDYAPSLDATAEKYAQRIVKSAETMDALVLDLLAYGKAARADLEMEQIELEDAWNVALSLFEQDIVDLGATITTLRPLPSIYASSTTLSQVLANLLGNALKFVPENVAPIIVFKAQDQGDTLRISIQDNGVGIVPEYHERIFRVFERLKGQKSQGTGIGLAIVKKGVERMGGRVGVKSSPPEKGSLFWIELKKKV